MSNTIGDNKALQRTYVPVAMRVVGFADAARLKGRSVARGAEPADRDEAAGQKELSLPFA